MTIFFIIILISKCLPCARTWAKFNAQNRCKVYKLIICNHVFHNFLSYTRTLLYRFTTSLLTVAVYMMRVIQSPYNPVRLLCLDDQKTTYGRVSVSIEWFSSINHERVVRYWWYLQIWLILMTCCSWLEVKVTRSKVKGKNAIMWKSCFSHKSQTNDWILIKLIHRVDIHRTFKVTQGQGHKVKGQGQKYNYVKILFQP